MHDDHLLRLNPRKAIRCLTSVLLPEEIEKIERELRRNVRQLLTLSEAHLRFARQASGVGSWRQRVSRGYYSVYSASKAIRLEISGVYSTESGDHKKIGDLPDDFSDANTWKDLLTKFRADRNLADYDHSVNERALELSGADYVVNAENFLKEVKRYLRNRGAI